MTTLRYAAPVLATLNLEKTLSFYQEKFGFEVSFQYPPGYGAVKREQIEIHFWLTDDPEIPKQTSCYIYVTDIEGLYAEYQATQVIHPNGALETKPYGVKEFSVLDGDGNLIKFGEVME